MKVKTNVKAGLNFTKQ